MTVKNSTKIDNFIVANLRYCIKNNHTVAWHEHPCHCPYTYTYIFDNAIYYIIIKCILLFAEIQVSLSYFYMNDMTKW